MNEIKYIEGRKRTTRLRENDGLYYLTFPLLEQEGLCHAFSTRLGGVSTGYFSTMNLSFQRQDDPEHVMENHRRLAAAVGYDEKRLVFSNQIHKTEIRKVTKEDVGKGIVRQSDIIGIDGLMTNEPGVPLMTLYADCVPLYFYDCVQKVVALAHSGWKGTVARIGKCMIECMSREYGSQPENILCAVGPSICRDCYEVGEDVAERFRAEFEQEACESFLFPDGNGKYHLDLHKTNEYILRNAGIRSENLSITDICTCCNPELLFSHRASQGKRGNLAAVIMLTE